MKTKLALALLAGAALVTLSFAVRQRTMNSLRASNQRLQQRLDAQTAAPAPAPDPAPVIRQTNAASELSAEERTELLRLRGQVLPLRSELQAASNRVVALNQPKPDSPMPAPSVQAKIQVGSPELQTRVQALQAFQRSETYTSAQSLASALRKYLLQNAGQLPDDLAKVEAFGDPALPPGVSQRFELIKSGTVPEEARSYTLVAREKDPQQSPDGWWRRIYFLADGLPFILSHQGQQPDWPAVERRVFEAAAQRAQQQPSAVPR